MAKAAPKSKKKSEPPEDDGDPNLNAFERAERNNDIVSAKMRGLRFPQIARSYNLSVRRCQQIVAEYRATNPSLRRRDPIEIADEMLEGYEADIEELVLIGATTTQDQVRVGAVNSRMAARGKAIELAQAIGVLPKDLRHLNVEIDARFVATTIVAVLDEHNVEDDIRDALLKALDGPPLIGPGDEEVDGEIVDAEVVE